MVGAFFFFWTVILAIEIHRRHWLALHDSVQRMTDTYFNEITAVSHSIEEQQTIRRSWDLWKQANAREFSQTIDNNPAAKTTTPNAAVCPSAWLFEYNNGSSFFTREKEEADLAKENPEDIVQVTEYFTSSTQSGVAAKGRDMPVASVFKAELFVARDTKQAFNTIVELPDADLKHGELLYRRQPLTKTE